MLTMTRGVSSGLILGSLLFNPYLPRHQIIHGNNVAHTSYAGDTQTYLTLTPSDYGSLDAISAPSK